MSDAARPSEARAVLAHSRVWRDGVVVDDEVTPEEMLTVALDPATLVWLDLVNPSDAVLAEVAAALRLAPTAVEDALAPHERPKVIRHDSHLFFTVYAATRSDAPPRRGRLTISRISGIVTPSALVTIRLDDTVAMDAVAARWEENRDLLKGGSGALVHGLLDYVVDGHFETIQQLDDQMEAIEDELFEQQPQSAHAFQRMLYGLRKDLVELRRVVLPMREVVNGVLRHSPSNDALNPYFDDLYDHVLRASEWTESLRDMVTSIFETNLSLQDARLNTIMKKLAGWAAIIAVPTLITSWYGQNIPYPGFNEPAGLIVCVVLIVVSTLSLYIVFKKQDWL